MNLNKSIDRLGKQIRTLQGEPHYIALGMALGVFAALTPTVPFQTVIAVTLALVLKASKPAAIIGSLAANPVTIPLFYMGNYKLGALLLGVTLPNEVEFESVLDLLKPGADVTIALLTGGVILGLMAGCLTYLMALKFLGVICRQWKKNKPEHGHKICATGPDPTTLPDKRLSS
jgi:uncharacterized protein (DUF2062 family)